MVWTSAAGSSILKEAHAMEGFTTVAQRSEITAEKMMLVSVDGVDIVLAELDGALVAFNNECTHSGCDLVYGALNGEEVECDCHGSRFNVRSGAVVNGPAKEPLAVYAVRVEGDDVQVGPA
jgi:nitrite reductase/ring-hydroxylating ferredoxin subunit